MADVTERTRADGTADATAARPRHVEGLDGLRAVAAVGVVFYHVHFLTAAATGPVATAAAAGWIGVDLFFAISGFILFVPFARAAREGRRIDVRMFFRRRARRILPAYWVNLFVLVTLVTPGLLTSARGWATILSNATFTADYLSLPSVNSVYWSLYCEMAFYLVLPLMARAFVRRRWIVGLPAAIAIGWLYRFVVVTSTPDVANHGNLVMQFPGVIDQFAFGMTAGAIWVWYETRPDRVPRWLTTALTVGGGGLALAVTWVIHREIGLAEFWAADESWGAVALATLRPWLSAGFAMMIFGICFHGTPLRRLLESRPVRYVGVVSYGLYLWHLPVIRALADDSHSVGRSSVYYLVVTAAVIMIALVWASLSYHLLEVRFIGSSHAPVRDPVPTRELTTT